MKKSHYNKNLKSFARDHRNNSTKAEVRLWCDLLRRNQMMGYSFLRQRPVGNFIVDFVCRELQLAIETDGGTHLFEEVIKLDAMKKKWLTENGFSVLRFKDLDVIYNLEWVKNQIEQWIFENHKDLNHPPTQLKH
ncbi:MAG: endonuclease domain-containing protein [Flavobacteriales bacterium]